MTTVLVTGATGYIAKHCILQLLEKGYRVRGTIRSESREAEMRQIFAQYNDQLEFVVADLMDDAGWDEAAVGCEYVMHTASPVPIGLVEDENTIIQPALQGTKRVLQAALKAGVKRLVLTSSVAAISYGHSDRTTPFDESDWSNLDGDVNAYVKAKSFAERTAWEFVEQNPDLELAAINPVVVIGPLLSDNINSSVESVYKIMKREYPALPNIGFGFVDVRDVAAAHVAAMTIPEVAGKRFICNKQSGWLRTSHKYSRSITNLKATNSPQAKFPISLFGL